MQLARLAIGRVCFVVWRNYFMKGIRLFCRAGTRLCEQHARALDVRDAAAKETHCWIQERSSRTLHLCV